MSPHHEVGPGGQVAQAEEYVTLEQVVQGLVDHFGWDELGRRIRIRCFNSDPSIKSSLKFLRRTPWARQQVEDLFVEARVPRRD